MQYHLLLLTIANINQMMYALKTMSKKKKRVITILHSGQFSTESLNV